MIPQELATKAIDAALRHDWKEAIRINLQILKTESKDLDALNRLGKAYLQQGFKTKSEEIYHKVLRLDKYNQIAAKALEAIKNFKVDRSQSAITHISTGSPLFLEEPGTTKTVTLIRLGDIKTLSHLQPGDEVFLAPREHCVSVVNAQQENVGRLPDDLASRLLPFLKAGNTYQVWIKTSEIHPSNPAKQNVRVFIREIQRVNKYRNIPSFPSTEKLSYAAFTPPELVHSEKPDISTPEEDTDNFVHSDDADGDEEKLPLPLPDDD